MSDKPSTSTSTSTAGTNTRSADQSKRSIALVGAVAHRIVGAKLPSKRQVLEVLFFCLRFRGLSCRKAADLVFDEVLLFWKKARIPTMQRPWCVQKIENLYNKWELARKNSNRDSETQQRAEKKCSDQLDDLFDFAAANALKTIPNQEDGDFLVSQRQKGRPGSMIGVDMALVAEEQRTVERKQKQDARKRRLLENKEKSGTNISICFSNIPYSCLISTFAAAEVNVGSIDVADEIFGESGDGIESETEIHHETNDNVQTVERPNTRKVRKRFMDAELVASLDFAKLTDACVLLEIWTICDFLVAIIYMK